MDGGYMDTIGYVDLTERRSRVERLDPEAAGAFLGGPICLWMSPEL